MRERAPLVAPSKTSTNFGDPTSNDTSSADKETERQRKIAQGLAAERQRLLEDNFQQEIRLADEVHRHKVELDQRRFDRQKELADLQARAEMARMSPNQRGIAELMRGIGQSTSDYDRRIREAEQRLEQANRQVANAQRMATVTGAGLGGGRAIPAFGGARTNRVRDRDAEATGWDIVMPGGRGAAVRAPLALTITGTGFQGSGAGPKGKGYGNWISGEFQLNGKTYELVLGHFDKIHVAKGMQVPVGGQLGTQGITGRTFGAHATAHVNPKNGASVNDAWRALDAITRIWEGRTTPGAVQRTPPGVAAQRRRNVVDGGDIAVALAGQQAAQTELNDLKENRAKFIDASANAQIAEYVRNTRDSTAALKEETQQLRDRNRLTLEGFRPEIVDGMVQQLAEQRRFQDERRQLDADIQSGDTDRARKATDTLNELTAAYESNIRAIQDRTQAQLDARAADENAFDFRRGARQYVESIGSMRDATASLTQTGIRGVEDALMSLATTGTANFQAFAVSILQETSRMIIQQLVLKTIMQALGFLGGGGLGGGSLNFADMAKYSVPLPSAMGNVFTEQGVQLFAKGGVVAKPTFFRYANGGSFANGVMGEAGPEAILPLKRGSDGKLGVSTGGGGSPVAVTVNVDASGTKAQGSSDQGQQLGRAVAAAVQAELVKQKRPGGLLAS
jgi:lambda family phage tail tape measure protein